MKLLRSLSNYWLVVHIGSWMLLTLFLAVTDSSDLPPQWMMFYMLDSAAIGGILLLISLVGFLTSGILYAIGRHLFFRTVVLLLVPFTCIIFTLFLTSPDSQRITHIETIHLNGHDYHLIKYPRSFFSPSLGNYFPYETAYVLYACGHDDYGCQAAYYDSREGWILNPSHADIVAEGTAINLYIDDELVFTLDEDDPLP